jgi:hypothetical protein
MAEAEAERQKVEKNVVVYRREKRERQREQMRVDRHLVVVIDTAM